MKYTGEHKDTLSWWEKHRPRFRIIRSEKYGWRSWLNPVGMYNIFEIRNELYLGKTAFALTFTIRDDSEGTFGWNIAIPYLFNWYFSVNAKFGYSEWWKKLWRLPPGFSMRDGRQWGMYWIPSYGCVDGGSFHLFLGKYLNEWKSTDPKWLDLYFYPQKLLFGDCVHSEKEISITTKDVIVPEYRGFPEKLHTLTCRRYDSTWTWPRFKAPLVVSRCEVTTADPEGIKHPGKGTTCYNCEDTGLMSSTFVESDVENAFAKFVADGMEYRRKYPL